MKELKLISLRFKNFKGIKEFLIEPNGNNIHIFGNNATGKTTIIDGYLWLLFGKDSEGKADFQLKPVGKDGSEKHNLDTEVSGVFSIDGELITLLKRYKEKYTKKQGTATNEFTGHTTDYFIDGVPVKKNKYEKFISGIADTDTFKLVSNPFEFNNLHWSDRRNFLIEMAGDVSNESIVKSLYPSDKKKSISLMNMLNKHSVEDNKRMINAQKKDINKELMVIPARIDEVTTSIKDVELPDPVVKKNIEISLNLETENLRKLKSNELISEKRIEVNKMRENVLKLKNEAIGKRDEKTKPLNKKITVLEDQIREKHQAIKDYDFYNDHSKEWNIKAEKELKDLREKFTFIIEDEDKSPTQCPACGQDLPESKIKEATEKFNDSKAELLKENNSKGKKLKDEVKKRQAEIKENEKSKALLENEIITLKNSIAEIQWMINELFETPFTPDPDLEKDIQIHLNQIAELESGSQQAEREIESRINLLKESLVDLETQEIEHNSAKRARLRISELESQEENLAIEYEKLEGRLFLLQEFIVKKVEALEDKINSKFKLARFKMFHTQINQGIDECCETIYDGVEFNKGLNSGAKINVGIDIINAISEHLEFQAPIFIDNRESLNELIETPAQVINLSVSKDKKLKIAS